MEAPLKQSGTKLVKPEISLLRADGGGVANTRYIPKKSIALHGERLGMQVLPIAACRDNGASGSDMTGWPFCGGQTRLPDSMHKKLLNAILSCR